MGRKFTATIRIIFKNKTVISRYITCGGELSELGLNLFRWIKEYRHNLLGSDEINEFAPFDNYYESISHTLDDFVYEVDLDERVVRISHRGVAACLTLNKIYSYKPRKIVAFLEEQCMNNNY